MPDAVTDDAHRFSESAHATTRGQVRLGLAVLTLIRLIQLASWPTAILSGGDQGLRDPDAAWVVWCVAGAVSLVVLVVAWAQGKVSPLMAFLDVVTACACLVVGGWVTSAGHGTDFNHPAVALAIGSGITAAVSWSLPRTVMASVALGGAYLFGVRATLEQGPWVITSAASNSLQLVGFAILTGVVADQASRVGRRYALVTAELAIARRTQASLGVRENERTRQYRTLHDTVLSTLSALSRGSLDPARPEVQQRLSADADYLRGLIATTSSAAGMRLVGELAALRREQAQVGLRVHPHIADVPDTLPNEVIRTVSLCIREALNNVVKHSHTLEAWVTIVGDNNEGSLHVSITDRGQGFDPTLTRMGVGLSQSIMARMVDEGGTSLLDSAPGQGTTIELKWPR